MITTENSNSRLIPLRGAAAITRVPYGTFISANRAGRLSLCKDDDGRLYIDAADLIRYMCYEAPTKRRWKPVRLPLGKIKTRPSLQPRTGKDGVLVGKLEDFLRTGGAADPIWIMRDGSELVLVDGHRRFEAAHRAEKAAISAIEIQLPFKYATSVSRLGNLRHGVNLSGRDQRASVLKHLEQNPAVAAALKEGKLSQAALAKALGLSVATVSRALREKKAPEAVEAVPTKSVLRDLHGLLGQLIGGRLPSEETAVGVIAIRSASEALVSNLSIVQVRDAKNAAANGIGLVAGRLTPLLKQLLDRRGGDRRLASKSA